ncbi:hypothetical protein LTR27_009019 [Elasticomyces elasticus]|nr:hypothetical protein LTR27_009019 [Elasticomyces elasticus]
MALFARSKSMVRRGSSWTGWRCATTSNGSGLAARLSIDFKASLHIRRVAGPSRSAKAAEDHVNLARLSDTDGIGERETFYRHFLSKDVRTPKFAPCDRLLSLDLDAVRRNLPQQLRANPLAAFKDLKTPLRDATHCLEAFVVSCGKDRSKIKDVLRAHKVGTPTLLWYMNSGLHLREDVHSEQPRFFRALTFCTSAEEMSEELWTMILSNEEAFSRDRGRRRGDLLRWMLEAQAFWQPCHAPLEVPLQTFDRAIDVTSISDGGVHIAVTLAGHWLEAALSSQAAALVSPIRWDRFYHQVRFYKGKTQDASLAQTILGLSRPQPDLPRAVAYWKQIARQEDDYSRDLLAATVKSTLYMLLWHLIRLAQHLDRRGNHIDARWVLDFGQQHFSSMFAMGGRVKLEPDGLALDAHNKRPPTAAERASGLVTQDVKTEAELRRVAALRELRGLR